MKAIDTYDNIITDIGWITRSAWLIGFLTARYEQQVNAFLEKYPEQKIEIDSTRISLVKCTDRAILMDFLQTFGGNWQKEINYWDKTKINYFQEITIREYLKYKIEANGAEPPASCRIVEEEVIVPEHKEMKKKLICEKEESEVKE